MYYVSMYIFTQKSIMYVHVCIFIIQRSIMYVSMFNTQRSIMCVCIFIIWRYIMYVFMFVYYSIMLFNVYYNTQ